MKLVKILDDNGNNIKVNIKDFYNHILKFHSKGTSIHEEDGHYFTVDEKLRKKIKEMLDSN